MTEVSEGSCKFVKIEIGEQVRDEDAIAQWEICYIKLKAKRLNCF
jgi:hypothetical protein